MDLGLLQRDVAAKIGVCEASVWNWESGGRDPEFRYLPAIVDFIGFDPRPEPEGIRRKLIQFRQGRGWTQSRLACELGVDPTTLSRWELGKKKPRGDFLERVCDLLRR